MLTFHSLKNSIVTSIIAGAFLTIMSSCGSDHAATISQPVVESTDNAISKANDEKLLVDAAEIYYEEILVGKLAQKRATSEKLKELARRLEQDSRDKKSELASLGIMKSISVPSVPSAEAHEVYDTLNAVALEEFDFQYIAQVIDRHNRLIRHFDQAAREEHDPDIKTFAAASSKKLEARLSEVKMIEAGFNAISMIED